MKIRARVPGKIMLAGEYSILYDYQALAVCVGCYADIVVCSSQENGLKVASNLWPSAQHFDLQKPPPLDQSVILDTIFRFCQKNRITGLTVEINSQILPEYGMGSSSALRLGTALALESLCQGSLIQDPKIQWLLAKDVIEDQGRFQGQASGYDVATHLAGGLVKFYQPFQDWPNGLEKTDPNTTLISQMMRVFVGGKGAATKAVLNDTLIWLTCHRLKNDLANKAQELIENLQAGLKPPIDRSVWQNIFAGIGRYRDLFLGSPHFPRGLHEALVSLNGADQDWSFKFTGAGGEDAILLFGDHQATESAAKCLVSYGWQEFKLAFSNDGITLGTMP